MATSAWIETLPSGKSRVCWRNEAKVSKDGKPVKPRDAASTDDRPTAERILGRVREALALEHYYIHEPTGPQRIADFEKSAQAWVDAREADGADPGTIDAYESALKRVCADIRALDRLGESAPIPASVLGIELGTRLKAHWRALKKRNGARLLSDWRIYDLCLHTLSAWKWMASQKDRYPNVPAPPYDQGLFLPKAPPRVRAAEPTLEEVDAICRRSAASTIADLRDIVASMRLSGLRVGQVRALRVRDFDLPRRTLVVATGKSRKEKAEKRVVALHQQLAELLQPRIEGRSPQDLVFPPSHGKHLRSSPSQAVRRLWEQATEAGEVRRGVWDPPSSGKARPDHAFRAAFLAALRAAKVEADVRHAFVGHAARSTEEQSYSGATLDDMREAIDRLPRIDWIEPKHGSVTPIRVREQVGEVAGRGGTAGDNVVAFPKLR